MLSRYIRPSTASATLPAIETDAEEQSSDVLLIQRIVNGDKLAMHALFAKHRTQVYRWLLRFVGNEAQAEDILSEVLLDVWRQAVMTPAPSVPRTAHRMPQMQCRFSLTRCPGRREIWARYPFMLKMGTPDFCGVETALIGPIWPVNGGSPNANTENSYPPGPLGAPDVAPKVAREVELV
jgi:hypothetical protein